MISERSICVEWHSRLIEKLLEIPEEMDFFPYLSTFLIFMRIGYFFLLFLRETIQSLFLFLPPPFKFYKCKFKKIWADLKMDYEENALA